MNETIAKTLMQTLAQLTATMGELSEMLQQEHDTLKSTNVESLNSLSQQKDAITRVAEQLNLTWIEQCRQIIPNIQAQEIDTLLAKIDTKHPLGLAQKWQSLCQLSQQCQQQNTVNGQIINLRRQATLQALNIIKGKPSSNTYGATGHSNDGNINGRMLATA